MVLVRHGRRDLAWLRANTHARSFVISCFAIAILSILGLCFKNNHEEFVGGIEDPEDGPAVASTIFVAVLVYIVSGRPGAPPPS